MIFVAAETAERGRDGSELLIGEVGPLGRIVMRQKHHSAESDQDEDDESKNEFHKGA